MKIETAFITGTGFYALPGMRTLNMEAVVSPYGEVEVEIAEFAGRTIAFIPRHGKQHHIAPGDINFRANIGALKTLGVRRILSTSVCGSLSEDYPPGSLVLIDQFLNFTSGRADTFFPMDGKLAHVDVTYPYCQTLHDQLMACAEQRQIQMKIGATYACWDGPRFETAAEIEMTRRLGGHLVGQTNYPECVLAREMAMCYATVGIVSNFAAGMKGTLSVAEVMDALGPIGGVLASLFAGMIEAYPDAPDCSCQHALDDAYV